MKMLVISILLIFCQAVRAQTDTSAVLRFSGFIDLYYQYDFDNPENHERPFFLYNYKRHNELNLNLALLKAAFQRKNTKANLVLMTGNYAEYNLAGEPALSRLIYEASIEYSFSGKLSLTAGIMPSHIGLETAISKDNWNLGRSLLADNSPYYETGVRLAFTPNGHWTTAVLVLNGWQNIRETNSGKAIGTMVQFKPNDRLLINSSTFAGNEKPDSARQMRVFHNFYTTFSLSRKLATALLFDIGAEQKPASQVYQAWYGGAFLLRCMVSSIYSAAFRAEYYSDPGGVIIPSRTSNGFRTSGFAVNIDYRPSENFTWRIEGRYLNSRDRLFDQGKSHGNYSVLSSMAVSF